MQIEDKYYSRIRDSAKPDWITVRGTSKLEGYHPHLRGILPGTGYAADTASGIYTLFNMQWSLKRGSDNKGDAECGVTEPWTQETLAQLCTKLGLSPDPFGSLKVPTSNEERFRVDCQQVEADLDRLHEEEARRRQEREEWEAPGERDLSEKEELLMAATKLDAMQFLGALLFSTLTC